jgi:hypothetical protein
MNLAELAQALHRWATALEAVVKNRDGEWKPEEAEVLGSIASEMRDVLATE